MTPIELLRSQLINTPAVTAIAGQRVYADIAPQGAEFPFVILTTEDGTTAECLSEPSAFYQDLVVLDVYSRERLESLELWKECARSMAHHKADSSATVLESCNQQSSISWAVYSLDDASDELVYQCSQNWQVNYSIKGFNP